MLCKTMFNAKLCIDLLFNLEKSVQLVLVFCICINDSEDDFKLHAQAKGFVLKPTCI